VNDNAPVFINDNATFYARENLAANSFIGQVIALDKDATGPNSDITFRILNEPMRHLFRVYKTGVVANLASTSFDRETQSLYVLKIEASDNGAANSLSSVGTFYVRIDDQNDNPPHFYYPKDTTRFINIKFPLFVNSSFAGAAAERSLLKLINVKAFDDDAGDNGRISYALTVFNNEPEHHGSLKMLKIDRQNGTLYFDYANLTDGEDLNAFKRVLNVSISASDHGTPVLSTSINLTFFLNYDSSELPEYVYNRLQQPGSDNNNNNNYKLNSLLVDSFRKPSGEGNRYEAISSSGNISGNKHRTTMLSLSQLVLNNFLLVFLLAILAVMMLVTCFVFAAIYSTRSGGAKSAASVTANVGSSKMAAVSSTSSSRSLSSLGEKRTVKRGFFDRWLGGKIKRRLVVGGGSCEIVVNKNHQQSCSVAGSRHDKLTVIFLQF
jgi:hypothetical protein